jgi:hypothetical protein
MEKEVLLAASADLKNHSRMVRDLMGADSLLFHRTVQQPMQRTVRGQGADGPWPDREFSIPFFSY